jgi:hypothetical protein
VILSSQWLRVPVGAQSSTWSTMPQARTVLAVAHTVTSTTRVLDTLRLFDGDTRIQILFSEIPASAFDDGLKAFLDDIEAKTISWEQAIHTRFDLAPCASSSGPLHAINAPLLIMPDLEEHGQAGVGGRGAAEVPASGQGVDRGRGGAADPKVAGGVPGHAGHGHR